ncbi:MAG TPA: TIGR04282 family arsenosugar biosynthesis glycosyltransferase [Nitrospiria bacterium]|nr:TIGR04282 family arsenosugar biosynthesis glycosyltransferase [Nitrospiria bacterium]
MTAAASRTRAARSQSSSSSTGSTQALIIFAKAPEPGEVKTRLSPPLTSKQAARLHEAFLLDVVRASHSLGGITRWLSCAPSTTHPYFRHLARRFRLRLLTQTGATLGERMASALRQALDAGATRAVLIGTDMPTLPPSILHNAFRQLRGVDVVLGPACDGGYYLVGVSRRVPPIFDCIPWGRSTVLEATLSGINRLGLRCRLLPFWYDVDALPSLRLLAAHLAALRRDAGTASRRLPAATARWCAAWTRAQNTKAPDGSRGPRRIRRNPR